MQDDTPTNAHLVAITTNFTAYPAPSNILHIILSGPAMSYLTCVAYIRSLRHLVSVVTRQTKLAETSQELFQEDSNCP